MQMGARPSKPRENKNMRIDLKSKKLELAQNSNVSHDSAEVMYDCYGAHISTDHDGDVCIQSVDYDWLDDDQDAKALLAERRPDMTADECESLVSLARHIREAMEGIEDALERASCAAVDGDFAGCIEALQEARDLETDHGDDPSTSALAAQLLREKEEPDAE